MWSTAYETGLNLIYFKYQEAITWSGFDAFLIQNRDLKWVAGNRRCVAFDMGKWKAWPHVCHYRPIVHDVTAPVTMHLEDKLAIYA
jgi:hypothetical protein